MMHINRKVWNLIEINLFLEDHGLETIGKSSSGSEI